MDQEEADRFWNGNSEAWTKLVRARFDVYRDRLNTPPFFDLLPDDAGLNPKGELTEYVRLRKPA